MKYGSVCSGIEAASVAWEPLGWKASWLAEIEAFPSAVLTHHWPGVQNLGDMTKISGMVKDRTVDAPDVLVGGTPCQAFSVAGLRNGLSDERGFLTIKFVELADEIDNTRKSNGLAPSIIVWENVPGVLSSKDNAFGCFLAALAGEDEELQPPGKKWSNAGCVFGPSRTVAWRVLDAKHFGVAQRRRRVFVVASAREGFNPAEVLFEFDGVRRDSASSREAGKEATGNAGAGAAVRSHWDGANNPHPTLSQSHNTGGISQSNQELFSQRGAGLVNGFRMVAFGEYAADGTASTMKARDYKDATDLAVSVIHGTQDPCVGESAIAYGIPGNWIGRAPENGGNATEPMHDVSPCLTSTDRHCLASIKQNSGQESMTPWEQQGRRVQGGNGVSPTLMCNPADGMKLEPVLSSAQMQVRRLTPTECERLQGFPDGHTNIPYKGKPAPDGQRYKALGNSMAVPVMQWIGERIDKLIRPV